MSIAGILSSSLFNSNRQAIATSKPSFQQEFQQLGQAPQSGNLAAARTDFAGLQQNSPLASATTPPGGPIVHAFSQLGKDLQSGNLAAAQQDFANIQPATQSQSAPAHPHHRHHGGGAGGGEQANIAQEFAQLGQQLQAGNVSAAQQAYGAVQRSVASFGASSDISSATTVSSVA